MALFHFDTVKTICILGLTLMVSHSGYADSSLKMKHTSSEFLQRLNQLYGAKKRPLPSELTESSFVEQSKPKDLKLPKNKDLSKDSIKMGGVSDGGGNAIGKTLFDFYENQGSLEVSLAELLYLEPKVIEILNYLDQEIPAVQGLNGLSFGKSMKASLENKKIFLETKRIESEACLNQSMVAIDGRDIVACQSDTELRINVLWMNSTDAKNRSGLLLHELILAWARGLSLKIPKADIEQKVRELNRIIFTQISEAESLAKAIRSVFEIKAYSVREISYGKALPEKMKKALKIFCENPKINLENDFKDYLEDPFLKGELSGSFFSMKRISEAARKLDISESDADIRNDLCADYSLDKVDDNRPKSGLITNDCRRDLDNMEIVIVRHFQGRNNMPEGDFSIVSSMQLNAVKAAIIACTAYTKNTDQMSTNALHYLKWRLKENGISISFMDGTLEKSN